GTARAIALLQQLLAHGVDVVHHCALADRVLDGGRDALHAEARTVGIHHEAQHRRAPPGIDTAPMVRMPSCSSISIATSPAGARARAGRRRDRCGAWTR